MYAKGAPIEIKRSVFAQLHQDEDAQKYFASLQNGEIQIFFAIDFERNLRYEAFAPSFYATVLMKPDGQIVYPFSKPNAKEIALVAYLFTREDNDDEATLRERYGADYDSLARLSSLQGAEREKYLKAKLAVAELAMTLREERRLAISAESKLETVSPRLSLELVSDDAGDGWDVRLTILGKRAHRIANIQTFLSKVSAEATINDGPGCYISLGVDHWSALDQRVIFFLSNLQNRWANAYRDDETGALSDPQVIALCKILLGQTIQIDGVPYAIGAEEREIAVSLDENGFIRQEGVRGKWFATHDLSLLTIYSRSRHLFLYRFRNRQEMMLSAFVEQNPDLPFGLFQEEISTEILPALTSEVQVSSEFKKKAQAYRSDIAYYLTYETEGETPFLVCETKFVSRGQEVTKEDYLLSNDPHYEEFVDELSRLSLLELGKISDEETIAAILESDFSRLSSHCLLYLSDNITPSLVRHAAPVSLRTSSGVDWFDVRFESDTLSPEEISAILKAYKKKKKYVRIGSSYFATDDKALGDAIKDFGPNDEGLTSVRLPLYQALKLHGNAGIRVSIDDRLQALFQSLLQYRSRKLKCDPAIKKQLRPYQIDGVKWLSNLAEKGLGGILADDMGLGKTLEVVAYLNDSDRDEPTLIVAPKSLLYNWKNEFAKWDPKRPVALVDGNKAERSAIIASMKKKSGTVYIVSYDSLRNDEALYQGISFGDLILDEAQFIANAAARKTKAVKSLSAAHRFVLTGTPIQNSFMDLWSIFDFLLPGYLEGFREFRMIYSGYSDAKEAEIQKLEREVAPFLLRRTKEEVLKDLPPKSEEVMLVSLEKEEQNLYAAYHKSAQISLHSAEEDRRNKVAILAELTRLRELCVDPSIFIDGFHGVSSKLTRTLEMVQEALSGGHKVLIFSSFVTVLKHLQKLLEDERIPASLIYGDTPAKERLDLADEFNTSDDIKVMLVSLKAGGTGLNLVGADIVIHLDPWWNVAAENQASDRAHRIGQTRPVSIFKLVAQGTIEEKIIELQKLKKGLTDIIRVADSRGLSLTEEDIAFLLS